MESRIFNIYIATITLFLYAVFEQWFSLAGSAIEFVYLRTGYNTPFLYTLLVILISGIFLCISIIFYKILFKWKRTFKIPFCVLLVLIVLKYLNFQVNISLAEYTTFYHDKHLQSFVAQRVVWEYFNYILFLVLLIFFYIKRDELKLNNPI